MKPVLYVTFDGILQPIGYSQVARIVMGLAERGVPYRLLSLERPKDLAKQGHTAEVRARLERAGVTWTALPYDVSGTTKAAGSNVGRATAEVTKLAATGQISLVHARAYHAALVTSAAHYTTRVPYLFDARSYWIDERITDGRWFGRRDVRTVARAIERRFFRDAAGVVTLTGIQANDLRTGKFGPWTGAPVVNIPTCADYDEFRLRDAEAAERVPSAIREKTRGKRVIGLVGSLNKSYYAGETLEVVRRALEKADDLHVLVLSDQQAEWRKLFDARGFDPSRVTIGVAPHSAMPAYMALVDFSVLLLVVNDAKRASVPTKLAELFASGVRPVYFGCNDEVTGWVAKAGSGHVLASLEDTELERAATFLAETKRDDAVLARARELTEGHFSLRTGLDRYAELVREITASR
ncbi:MAG: hypothetical protein IPK71_02225 [Myxococcales bacterium]|nr:hypothetical protein [Myxococcales bacterium]